MATRLRWRAPQSWRSRKRSGSMSPMPWRDARVSPEWLLRPPPRRAVVEVRKMPDPRLKTHIPHAIDHLARAGDSMVGRQIVAGLSAGNVPPWAGADDQDFH